MLDEIDGRTKVDTQEEMPENTMLRVLDMLSVLK